MAIKSSRKRKKKVYSLEAFPNSSDIPAPFRNSIAYFRQIFTHPDEDYTIQNLRISVVNLVHKQTPVKLFLIEHVPQKPFQCLHCVDSGWGNHYITTRDFVLFIPQDLQSKPLDYDDVARGPAVLCGLVHYNGFGHLLSVNGHESGSELLSGTEIMNLWDRICFNLHICKISLKDLAHKKNMEVRLVHGMAYGRTWFAKWGYRFVKGRFGINVMDYPLLLDTLRWIPVNAFASSTGLTDMISFYIDKHPEVDFLGDLFNVMLNTSVQYENFSTRLEKSENSRWPRSLVEAIAGAVVGLLRGVGESGMLSEEIHTRIGGQVGEEMMEYILELLSNSRYENYIVCSEINVGSNGINFKYSVMEAIRDINADLQGLYQALRDFNAATGIEVSVKAVMDAVFFVKEFEVIKESDNLLNLFCHVRPVPVELGKKFNKGFAPAEHIVVSVYSKLTELKMMVENAMKESYFCMDKLKVTEAEVERVSNEELVNRFGSGLELFFFASDLEFVYVGGNEMKEVNCSCKSMDFDGEKMVSCSVCGIYQHVQCSGMNSIMMYNVCTRCVSKGIRAFLQSSKG